MKNTVEFRAMGAVQRTARVKRGESHYQAAIRAGINLQGENGNGDKTVWLAEYKGQRGEARFQ